MADGLTLTVKTNAQLEKEANADMQKFNLDEPVSPLASHIKHVWERNRRFRESLDIRLLRCLRARKGQYSDEELHKILDHGGADPVYIKLTGTKCRAAAAWTKDILSPATGEWPFSMDPTPIPSLPPQIEHSVLLTVADKIQQLQMSPDEALSFEQTVREKVVNQMFAEAKKASKGMERKVQDIMVEGGWHEALDEFIEDFVTYPTAFMKGPYLRKKRTLTWGDNFEPKVEWETQMAWRRVSPFDIFHSPHSRSLQEGDLIERLRWSRDHVYNLIGMPGYHEENIRKVLDEYDYGHLDRWIWEDFEREYLETDSGYFVSDKDTIDALHFWGSVKGKDLEDWGVKNIDDPLKQYEVDAILIGNYVIRAVINEHPLGLRPYHHACWDAIPGSLTGNALPEQMEDIQRMINASARALANNLGISSGPQAVVLTDMLAAGEDITEMYPWKIWQMKSSITGNSGAPVQFFQPSSNADVLLAVISNFEQKADDVTSVPRYAYGGDQAKGAGQTYRGLSLLMGSTAKGIRKAISNIDKGVIKPSVFQTFIEVMQNDDDSSIKRDVKINPRGSAALLIKEQEAEGRRVFLGQITNDFDMKIVGMEGRAYVLREIAKDLGLDPEEIFPDGADLKEQQLQAQMQQMQTVIAEQQQQLQEQADKLRAKEMELMNRIQRVGERELAAGEAEAIVKVQAELNAVKDEQRKIKEMGLDLTTREEKLNVLIKANEVGKQAADVVFQKARFEHQSADFERRISDANDEKVYQKIKGLADKALAAVNIIELKLSQQNQAPAEQQSIEAQPPQEDLQTQANQIRMDVLTQFQSLLQELNRPKQVVRDAEGRIDKVVTNV